MRVLQITANQQVIAVSSKGLNIVKFSHEIINSHENTFINVTVVIMSLPLQGI